VYDRQVKCFIDTGSTISLIKESLAQTFINKYNLKVTSSNKVLKNVSNEIVKNLGKINVKFKTEYKRSYHCLYIVDDFSCFEGGILLGRDFLTRSKAIINYAGDKNICIYGSTYYLQQTYRNAPQITCLNKYNDENDISACYGKTTKSLTIPKSNALFLNVKVTNENFNNKMIVASENNLSQGLLFPRVLAYVKDNLIPITLFNLTDKDIHINVNKTIAKIFLCTEENETVRDETFSMAQTDRKSFADKPSGNCDKENCINLLSTEDVSNTDFVYDESKINDKDFNDTINEINLNHLNDEQKRKIVNVLYKYRDAIAVREEIGKANFIEHEIYVDNNQPPIATPQYRVPYAARKIIDDHVQKLLRQGVIEPSKSPWSSPVLLVRKHNSNEFRFCVDFRKLNTIIKKDLYPIPRIDDTLENLQGASIFSTLDFTNSFHQIPLAENSREYTAFRTISGNYQYRTTPQGLSISSAAFMRACNLAFDEQLKKFLYAYIDDLVIYSHSFEEHLGHLEEVLQQIEKCGFKLGLKKCKFASDSVKYLGHVVSKEGIRVDPSKTEAISKATRPRNARQVRSFLGTAGYYRKFIQNFAGIAAPLTNLTKKNTRFKWTHACQQAFETLKLKLTTAPVLSYPHRERRYILHTDASDNAIGAVLNQYNESSKCEQPIAYFSRKLKDTEIKYSISEREALAIYESVKNFQPYLWLQKFKIITDHTALKFLFKNKNTVPRIARWSLYLSDFEYEIEYKCGKAHFVPDYLSRNACNTEAVINAIDVDDTSEMHDNEVPENEIKLDADTLKREQNNDPDLKIIIDYLEGKTVGIPKLSTNCNADEFMLEDGILYRLPRFNYKISKLPLQTVIPKTLIKTALKLVHNSNIAAHQGFLRTLHRARDSFYWQNMSRDIKIYVRCCIDCQKRKWQGREIGELGEFPEINYPLDRVGVDLIELPTSYKGNKFILTVVDSFTKYVSAYAIPNKSAVTVTEAMMQFITNNSSPKEITSDRGSEFHCKLFQETCSMLNSKNKYTTAYHPMANGLTEKYNSTIKKVLSNICATDQLTWDDQLPSALLAINTSFQTSINEIPFFLFHGRDARLPFNDIINKQPPINYAEENYKHEMLCRLNKAFAHVKKMSKISREQYANQYNKRATKCKINVGDIVLLRNETGISEFENCWPTRYVGPYRVINKIKNNFTIKGIYADTKTQTVHVNRIKLAHLLPNNAYPFNNHDPTEITVNDNNTGVTGVQETQPTNSAGTTETVQSDMPAGISVTQPSLDSTNNKTPHRYNLRSRR